MERFAGIHGEPTRCGRTLWPVQGIDHQRGHIDLDIRRTREPGIVHVHVHTTLWRRRRLIVQGDRFALKGIGGVRRRSVLFGGIHNERLEKLGLGRGIQIVERLPLQEIL